MDPGKQPTGAGEAMHSAIERELNRWSRAAWAIDPVRGVVVAANSAGLRLVGVPEDGRGRLPVAAPALQPAIEAAHAAAGGSESGTSGFARLRLATPEGGAVLGCDIYRLELAPGIVIVAVSDREAKRDGDDDVDGAERAEPRRRERDDAQTLAEIARRIREALAGSRSRGEAGSAAAPAAGRAEGGGAGVEHRDAANERPGASREARLAHELRTPLSAIMAAAEIMKDERFGGLGDARYRGYAADIHESARHAIGVIDAMLGTRSAAQEPAGGDERASEQQLQLQLQFAEIDIGKIATSAVSSMQPLANAAEVALRLEVAARLPHVIADAVSVRQILFNLVTNALKFTARGGVVRVSLGYRPDAPLVLAVSDTGRGMGPAQLAAANGHGPSVAAGTGERASDQTGLGLGLSIVRALAAVNGAQVWAESAPGSGTRVTVTFGRDRLVPV